MDIMELIAVAEPPSRQLRKLSSSDGRQVGKVKPAHFVRAGRAGRRLPSFRDVADGVHDMCAVRSEHLSNSGAIPLFAPVTMAV
jgi:hypothetical protein